MLGNCRAFSLLELSSLQLTEAYDHTSAEKSKYGSKVLIDSYCPKALRASATRGSSVDWPRMLR